MALSITQGIISSKNDFDNISLVQISASVSPGSSGSPILNEYGEVVGMIIFYLKDGQNLNYGISAKDLKIYGIKETSTYIEIKPRQEQEDDSTRLQEILRTFRTEYYSYSDFKNFNLYTVNFAINCIFAGRGYRFKDPKILQKFSKYSWYKPDTNNEPIARSRMNIFEIKNLGLLLKSRKTLQNQKRSPSESE